MPTLQDRTEAFPFRRLLRFVLGLVLQVQKDTQVSQNVRQLFWIT